ncbi:MAG: hypothetical protein GY816_06310 [Cytophagales bacterium]|nr:hypothetical protein [Cytophagales bacterium]
MLLVFFLTSWVSASDLADRDENKSKSELGDKKEGESSKAIISTDPIEKTENKEVLPKLTVEKGEIDSDSTDVTVNKYNFILYFIYKHKYDSRSESLRNFLQ